MDQVPLTWRYGGVERGEGGKMKIIRNIFWKTHKRVFQEFFPELKVVVESLAQAELGHDSLGSVEVEFQDIHEDVLIRRKLYPTDLEITLVVPLKEGKPEGYLYPRAELPGGVTLKWGWRSDGQSDGEITGYGLWLHKQRLPLSKKGVEEAVRVVVEQMKKEVAAKLDEAWQNWQK